MTTAAEQHRRIDHSLTNQPPSDQDIVEAFEELRDYLKNAGHAIVVFSPDSREKSLALTHIEEATMWAIKAIALDQDGARAHWKRALEEVREATGVDQPYESPTLTSVFHRGDIIGPHEVTADEQIEAARQEEDDREDAINDALDDLRALCFTEADADRRYIDAREAAMRATAVWREAEEALCKARDARREAERCVYRRVAGEPDPVVHEPESSDG